MSNTGHYVVTLSEALQHALQGEDNLLIDVGVLVDDGYGATATTTLTITVEDDSPVARLANHSVYVGVDNINVNDLDAGFSNPVGNNPNGGSNQIRQIDTDQATNANEPAAYDTDQLRWGDNSSGTPLAVGSQSGYDLVDNAALVTSTGQDVKVGQEFLLGTFNHVNLPVYYTSLVSTNATWSADVVINGVSTRVEYTVTISHLETPNTDPDPRDRVTLPSGEVTVTVGTQQYQVVLLGFKDANGNVVSTVYTNENDSSNNFGIWGVVRSTDPLPAISSTVYGEAGADTGTLAWDAADVAANAAYGTFVGNTDGTYSFVMNRATKDSLDVGETLSITYDYTVTDSDGDTATATLTINMGGYQNITGTSGNDTLTGTTSNELLTGLAGGDSLSGGAGNDVLIGGKDSDQTLTGGDGADVFKWQLNDSATTTSPASDTVTDFQSADVLDLRDLLVGEEHAHGIGNLADYLSFSLSGSDTVIEINTTGALAANGPNQVITLTGVDAFSFYTPGSTDNAALIQALLDNGKLIVD